MLALKEGGENELLRLRVLAGLVYPSESGKADWRESESEMARETRA